MGKIIRRILTIIPAVALQSLWLLLLMKWLTPYAPIIVSPLSVAAFLLQRHMDYKERLVLE